MNTHLVELLRKYQVEELPVGFSIWRDGDAALWGYVREITNKGIWFLEIDTLGRLEDHEVFRRWSRFMEFDFGVAYGERLKQFAEFTPTVGESGSWRRTAKDRDRILLRALEDKVVVQIWKPDGLKPSIIVRSLEAGFLVYNELDNSCREGDREVIRLSLIKAVREYDAMAEAETWLWRRQNFE